MLTNLITQGLAVGAIRRYRRIWPIARPCVRTKWIKGCYDETLVIIGYSLIHFINLKHYDYDAQ